MNQMFRALIETALHPVLVTVDNDGLTGLILLDVEQASKYRRINKLQPKPSQMELINLQDTIDWIENYFSNQPAKLPTLALKGLNEFTQKVLLELCNTNRGQTITYGELALKSGNPKASRAIGSAMAENPITLVIPCHRVVPSDGGVGNYSGHGGTTTKQWLLDHESA